MNTKLVKKVGNWFSQNDYIYIVLRTASVVFCAMGVFKHWAWFVLGWLCLMGSIAAEVARMTAEERTEFFKFKAGSAGMGGPG